MSEWNAGYLADVDYTYGYYSQLDPLHMRIAFLYAGLAFPEVATACELGFGQGISVNMHAAASRVEWYGTDFNPTQVGFARELAAASGARLRLFEQSFAEFCNRADLPDFDFIAMHGIWSWTSKKNRATILDFVRRKLKVGGVLYLSYNTLPGWAAFAPMRHLLKRHHEVMCSPGSGIISCVDSSIAFAEQLLATRPAYAVANPQVPERIRKIKGENRSYLAHEYFNKEWNCAYFAEMADLLTSIRLNFACSAHYLDLVDDLNLTPDQQAFLGGIPDPMFRETVRDYCVNQQFRTDYWVNGAHRLHPLEQGEKLRAQRVILLRQREDVSPKVKGRLGEMTMQEPLYAPILDALADHLPRSLGEIEQAVQDKGISFAEMVRAVIVLIGAASITPAQDEAIAGKAREQTDKLNAFLCNKALYGDEIVNLASPVIGGAVTTGRFDQLFLLARSQGKKLPAEWAQFTWQVLLTQGLKIVSEGEVLETEEENLNALLEQARIFADRHLPILEALGIA